MITPWYISFIYRIVRTVNLQEFCFIGIFEHVIQLGTNNNVSGNSNVDNKQLLNCHNYITTKRARD